MTDDMKPFRIEVPQPDIDDLRQRLRNTRWPDELPGVGWQYGAPLGYIKELAEYWREKYDWRVWEARLNEFPQFTTTIDGANVHFLHARSPEPDAMPLLITHGWPGSIVEYIELLGPLTDPKAHGAADAPAFHVVLPSIPGYGFSGTTQETGWSMQRVAKAWVELMRRLGYGRYGAHGGDWGSAISREIGVQDPEHVSGVHLTMLAGRPPSDPSAMSELTDRDKQSLAGLAYFMQEGNGYFTQQSTRPQTLAYGLTDSPAGQLAWIVEKFWEWTDRETSPDDAVDRDHLLTNVSIYWFTATAGSSARLYYETAHSDRNWTSEPVKSTVPTGAAAFPKEIASPIKAFATRSNNIVHWSEFDRGGHFAAMEEPDLLLGDIRAFFGSLR